MQVHIVHEHIPKLFTFPSPNPWPIYSPRQFYFHFYVRLTDMRSAYSWRGFCFPSSCQGVHDWCCVGFFYATCSFSCTFHIFFQFLEAFWQSSSLFGMDFFFLFWLSSLSVHMETTSSLSSHHYCISWYFDYKNRTLRTEEISQWMHNCL